MKNDITREYLKLKQRIAELETAIKSILHWKARAETTPEMLLSTQPDNSDVCIEIMRNYEESFKTALQALKDKEK